jgi:hypothetical protein
VAQLSTLGGCITMKRHIFTLLALVLLVGCVSRPQNTTKSQSDAMTSLVATCPAYSLTGFNIMTLLKDKNIHAFGTISGTVWIYVYPEEAAKARVLLASVAKDDKFKGMEVVE